MRLVIIVVLVLIVAAGIYFMGKAGSAPGSGSGAGANPGAILADGISTDLDFQTRAALEVRIISQERDFKQLLAMGSTVDEDLGRTELKSFEALQEDVAQARENLQRTGTPPQAFDAWLAKLDWAGVRGLAEQVRSKVQQSGLAP